MKLVIEVDIDEPEAHRKPRCSVQIREDYTNINHVLDVSPEFAGRFIGEQLALLIERRLDQKEK